MAPSVGMTYALASATVGVKKIKSNTSFKKKIYTQPRATYSFRKQPSQKVEKMQEVKEIKRGYFFINFEEKLHFTLDAHAGLF